MQKNEQNVVEKVAKEIAALMVAENGHVFETDDETEEFLGKCEKLVDRLIMLRSAKLKDVSLKMDIAVSRYLAYRQEYEEAMSDSRDFMLLQSIAADLRLLSAAQ